MGKDSQEKYLIVALVALQQSWPSESEPTFHTLTSVKRKDLQRGKIIFLNFCARTKQQYLMEAAIAIYYPDVTRI